MGTVLITNFLLSAERQREFCQRKVLKNETKKEFLNALFSNFWTLYTIPYSLYRIVYTSSHVYIYFFKRDWRAYPIKCYFHDYKCHNWKNTKFASLIENIDTVYPTLYIENPSVMNMSNVKQVQDSQKCVRYGVRTVLYNIDMVCYFVSFFFDFFLISPFFIDFFSFFIFFLQLMKTNLYAFLCFYNC